MNKMAARLLERVFVKVHIRAAWNKLHNMTEQSELSSALESLIHLTASESSYCELLGVMVDMISTDSLGIAAPFLCHIIDMATLPSQQTTRRMSQQLLSKCDPSGLARLRSKKKNKPTVALIWSVLANRLTGEMSSTLFSDAVCDCLLNNIENDPDMACKVFSIIALEKFSLTGPCKIRIMKRPIRQLLRDVANLTTAGVTNPEEISGILQAKFCAEWSLRNIFRAASEVVESTTNTAGAGTGTGLQDNQSHSTTHTAQDIPIQGPSSSSSSSTSSSSSSSSTTLENEGAGKAASSNTSSINVMLNTLDATRHWKISEDGLSVRNDGSTFESIRATKNVSQGKWYYEVTLITAGIMQIGWASVHCQFSPDDGTGVGDDIFGFAYDGCRNLMWADGESEPYGGTEAWKPGDVIGLYLDVDNAITECFLNGKSLGKISPFERDHFGIQAISGYFPALSFTSFQQATVNFGATPFRYPPALPWRNLNDYGTISPDMREAIVRPRNDSIYGRFQVDPTTGVRLPFNPEDGSEIDYSVLCTICCDHTATITLQPCGHDGLCVECAYSLDICPLCRSRIFQRQMFPSSESKDAESSCGLGISGISSDESSTQTSIPGLSTSSTSTSAWSAEYCGPSVTNPTHQDPTPSTSTLDHHRHHQHSASAVTAAAVMDALGSQQYPSSESLARRRNTVAAPSSSPGRALSEMDCPDDPFSPPSTAYFAFLNRPPRMPRSSLHPMDMESVDPLELPTRRQRHHHHPLAESSESSTTSQERTTFPPLGPLGPISESGGIGPLDGEPSFDFGEAGQDPVSMSNSSVLDGDIEDNNGMDVVLVEEGREASDSEVMEQSALDFQDGHSIHSRRNSVQVPSSLPPIDETAIPTGLNGSHGIPGIGPLSIAPDFARMTIPMSNSNLSSSSSISTMGFGAGINMGTAPVGNTTRFGGRRVSMPTNRLEM